MKKLNCGSQGLEDNDKIHKMMIAIIMRIPFLVYIKFSFPET